MDSLKRDWLSGGFVPHGGIGSFLPFLKPSPPGSHQSHPQPQFGGTRSARTLRIAKSVDHSPRSLHKNLGRSGASSARESRTRQAVARHRVTSTMLDSMGAPAASASVFRRPTTRENARGLMCEHGLGQPKVGEPTRRRVCESAGPVAALRAAKHIGLRAEVEHCAAMVLQTVLRTRRPKKQRHLHRAAMTIQGMIRHRNFARNMRSRVAKMDDGAREEHKAKARQRELENLKNFFHERFQEWAAEQAQEQREESPKELHDAQSVANEQPSAEEEARDPLDAAREAAMIRDRERLRQEHNHRRKRREQLLRQTQIKQTWDEINSARIRSVEVEQKQRVVQERRSVHRLNHQILSIVLESWRVYAAVRRRLERSNVAGMIPTSMLAIEKHIVWRKSQLNDTGEPSGLRSARAPSAEDVASASRSAGSYSPRDVGVINSTMRVLKGKGRQAFLRGFLVWKQWCASLKTDRTAARSQSKLACLFRFYLAAARGVEFTSASASFAAAAGQYPANGDQPASPVTGAPSSSETNLMLVLEDAAEDSSGEVENGDCLPHLGAGRGTGHVVDTLVGGQSASPRSGRGSEQTQGASTSSARSPAERKLASYQLPSLELVRTSVRSLAPLLGLQPPSAQSCVH